MRLRTIDAKQYRTLLDKFALFSRNFRHYTTIKMLHHLDAAGRNNFARGTSFMRVNAAHARKIKTNAPTRYRIGLTKAGTSSSSIWMLSDRRLRSLLPSGVVSGDSGSLPPSFFFKNSLLLKNI
jgi:hypothetical protein